MNRLYYRCLSKLGVNRNIRREARYLPKEWGGLGMFLLNIENLGARCLLILNHWGKQSEVGKALQTSYEVFRTDTGLGGNIFACNFDVLGHLAKHCWWKTTWHLCHLYNAQINLASKYGPPSPRENEPTVMDLFLSQGIWDRLELAILNRVRRYLKVFFRSDLIACDGQSVRADMLSRRPGVSTWNFSKEEPTTKDFKLWETAIRSISSSTLTFQSQFGPLRRVPANINGWYVNDGGDTIVHKVEDAPMRFYYRDNARSTRRSKFSLDPNKHHDTIDTSSWNLATTLPVANDPSQIMLHSSCPQPQPQPVNGNTDSLLDALRALPNSDLWEDAECDDDGWWIEESINSGDLVCVSDGSYKPEKAPDVCSCAFRLICKRTKRKFQCTWVERRSEASIYRGEILGTVEYLIVLTVVATRSLSALIQPRVDGTRHRGQQRGDN